MQAQIVRFDHQGQGIALVNNLVTFVPKTIPGDIVEIEIIETKKNYQKAKLVKIIKPALSRKESFCPFYDACGGCDLQNLDYEATLEYKKNKVKDILKREGIIVEPMIKKNLSPQNYRNKITLKVKNGQIGYYEKKTNTLIQITSCAISKPILNEIMELLPKINIINGEVTLRCNEKNEVLVIITSTDKLNLDILKNKTNVKGIILNNKLLMGTDFLKMVVNDLSFQVSFDAFFQVNSDIAKIMLELIGENVRKKARVLDLYCGVGTLSLMAASTASEVLGIEIVVSAINNAKINAQKNNINNAKFRVGNVEKIITGLPNNYDTWIVDPPRQGLDKKTRDVMLQSLPSKIIYVSCDPNTLARDLKELLAKYTIKKYYLLDMFSYTHHVESFCVLNLK